MTYQAIKFTVDLIWWGLLKLAPITVNQQSLIKQSIKSMMAIIISCYLLLENITNVSICIMFTYINLILQAHSTTLHVGKEDPFIYSTSLSINCPHVPAIFCLFLIPLSPSVSLSSSVSVH